MVRKPTISEISTHLHDRHVAWILWVKDVTGKSVSKIAEEADVSNSVLTEKIAGRDMGTLSPNTIAKICLQHGVPAPDALPTNIDEWPRVWPLPVPAAHGFFEEAEDYIPGKTPSRTDEAVAAYERGNANIYAKVMQSDVLAFAGVRKGDILILERGAKYKTGDIVCAQIIVGTGAKTVYRLFQSSLIIGAGLDPVKPEHVDDDRVSIASVMIALIRPRD